MRLKGGEFKKNIEIEAGQFKYVEIHFLDSDANWYL